MGFMDSLLLNVICAISPMQQINKHINIYENDFFKFVFFVCFLIKTNKESVNTADNIKQISVGKLANIIQNLQQFILCNQ